MKNSPEDKYNVGLAIDRKHTTKSPFPWLANQIEEYVAYRIDEPISIDGHLDEPAWKAAPRSPRFSDMITGAKSIHDTRAAVLWDELNLYVGFWVEEPNIEADLTERDSLIFNNNDVELFIAGRDAYYEFEINALGTIYEVFFIWDQFYELVDYGKEPALRKDHPQAKAFNGVGFKTHPLGLRTGFWGYDLLGLRSAVHIDGTLNDSSDRDRGWTVEMSIPWKSLYWLAIADNRSLPPQEGDIWRMDFSRFNQYREAPPADDSSGFFWSPHGSRDSHIPECFPIIHFSEERLTV